MQISSSADSALDTMKKSALPSGEQRARLKRWRNFKDAASRYGIGLAGISVVISLATIFIYLFSEVGPLFSSASIEHQQQYQRELNPQTKILHSNLERYNEVAMTVNSSGIIDFFFGC